MSFSLKIVIFHFFFIFFLSSLDNFSCLAPNSQQILSEQEPRHYEYSEQSSSSSENRSLNFAANNIFHRPFHNDKLTWFSFFKNSFYKLKHRLSKMNKISFLRNCLLFPINVIILIMISPVNNIYYNSIIIFIKNHRHFYFEACNYHYACFISILYCLILISFAMLLFYLPSAPIRWKIYFFLMIACYLVGLLFSLKILYLFFVVRDFFIHVIASPLVCIWTILTKNFSNIQWSKSAIIQKLLMYFCLIGMFVLFLLFLVGSNVIFVFILYGLIAYYSIGFISYLSIFLYKKKSLREAEQEEDLLQRDPPSQGTFPMADEHFPLDFLNQKLFWKVKNTAGINPQNQGEFPDTDNDLQREKGEQADRSLRQKEGVKNFVDNIEKRNLSQDQINILLLSKEKKILLTRHMHEMKIDFMEKSDLIDKEISELQKNESAFDLQKIQNLHIKIKAISYDEEELLNIDIQQWVLEAKKKFIGLKKTIEKEFDWIFTQSFEFHKIKNEIETFQQTRIKTLNDIKSSHQITSTAS